MTINVRKSVVLEYAKYAMNPLWTEIMAPIRTILDGGATDDGTPNKSPPKLALFAGVRIRNKIY